MSLFVRKKSHWQTQKEKNPTFIYCYLIAEEPGRLIKLAWSPGGHKGLLCLQRQFGHCSFDLRLQRLNRPVSITHSTRELGFEFPQQAKKQYIRRGLSACSLRVLIPLILIWCDAFHQMCLPERYLMPRRPWSCLRVLGLDFFPLRKRLEEGIHNLKSAYIDMTYVKNIWENSCKDLNNNNIWEISSK